MTWCGPRLHEPHVRERSCGLADFHESGHWTILAIKLKFLKWMYKIELFKMAFLSLITNNVQEM